MLKDDQVRILNLARSDKRCFIHVCEFYKNKQVLIPDEHLGVIVFS
jgi:hypothetical protein